MNISLFDCIYLFYIAITQSLFVQISAILIFRIAAYYIYNPKPDWYYTEDQDASL